MVEKINKRKYALRKLFRNINFLTTATLTVKTLKK